MSTEELDAAIARATTPPSAIAPIPSSGFPGAPSGAAMSASSSTLSREAPSTTPRIPRPAAVAATITCTGFAVA